MSKLLMETYRQEQGVTGNLKTGYMTSGMETAGALHRLKYGTREAVVMMCEKLSGNVDIKCQQTVQQKFYSSYCCSIVA
jgi:hypothetical protein